MLRGDMQAAAHIIDEIVPLIREERFLFPLQVLGPLTSILSFNIHSYASAKDDGKRKEVLKKTLSVLKQVRKYGPKFIFRYPEALRLAGTFYWLTGKQGAARKCWKEGLAIAGKLGLKPELGRISFEVAKRLTGPESRQKSLSNLGISHYVKTAREIFTEIGLDVDLKELEDWEHETATRAHGAETI